MVVGTQAHQPQTFELYNGKPIYYGLGNLMFDQTYWPGTERSLILTHYFVNGKYVQTRISPTVYDKSYQPALMDEANAESYVTRLINATK
jgi:poly-gamma-glutamate synthesis protein (capsule biosynthesis protein)